MRLHPPAMFAVLSVLAIPGAYRVGQLVGTAVTRAYYFTTPDLREWSRRNG